MIALKVYEMQTEIQKDLQDLIMPSNKKTTKQGELLYKLQKEFAWQEDKTKVLQKTVGYHEVKINSIETCIRELNPLIN